MAPTWAVPGLFRHCKTFFSNFFSPKVPLQFFWWFATEWMKNLKVSPLVRQFGSTFGFFRYRRRQYFDTLKSFCYFWALDMAPTWAVPGFFRNCETFFQICFSPKGPFNYFDDFRQKGWKMSKRSPGAPIRSNFWVFGCFRREYFDTLKSFGYFWALDMAPTWVVPGLFKLSTNSFMVLVADDWSDFRSASRAGMDWQGWCWRISLRPTSSCGSNSPWKRRRRASWSTCPDTTTTFACSATAIMLTHSPTWKRYTDTHSS